MVASRLPQVTRARFTALLLASALTACSSGAPPATTSPEGTASSEPAATEAPEPMEPVEPTEPGAAQAGATARTWMDEGFFMAEGAPAPRACTADADCVGNTRPTPDGCCSAPQSIVPHSRAYASWVSTWRRSHCADVSCPPPPPPARPADCHFELRCEAAQCRDACGD